MNRIHRNQTEILSDRNNIQYNRSPIRRHNINHPNPARSPIRSRTPTRCVSPIKANNGYQASIKFITNVSPIKDRQNNIQNQLQMSNGKSIKFISSNLTDKNYQSSKKQKYMDHSKKTDRITQEDNRLFGKLVDKLNSQKKPSLKSNETSYKTSVFGDNSGSKPQKMEQTAGKPEGGVFRQLFTQMKVNEAKPDSRPTSKNKEDYVSDQTQGLSCLVYKIKSNIQAQKQEIKAKNIQTSPLKETNSANTPSILLKRKQSKLQEQLKENPPALRKKATSRKDQEEEFNDFNILLNYIQQDLKSKGKPVSQDLVQMSFRVQQSMNMDPFI